MCQSAAVRPHCFGAAFLRGIIYELTSARLFFKENFVAKRRDLLLVDVLLMLDRFLSNDVCNVSCKVAAMFFFLQ